MAFALGVMCPPAFIPDGAAIQLNYPERSFLQTPMLAWYPAGQNLAGRLIVSHLPAVIIKIGSINAIKSLENFQGGTNR